MSEKFLQLNIEKDINHEGDWLASKYPNAFILLYFIARRARRTPGLMDGLDIGTAKIGDWEKIGLSRQNYRTALKVLIIYKFIEILETNRTRKKSTTGSTTEGTLVRLLDSRIWDINIQEGNQRANHCPTTAQPLPNHEQYSKDSSANVVVVVNAQAQGKENELAKKCKDWMDKHAKVKRKRKVGRENVEVMWGDDWLLPLKVFESLISKYGYELFEDQMNYMVKYQLDFDRGKGKKGIDNPEAFLRKACQENWALTKK